MTTSLPFEILIAIFEQVDDVQDLTHVRTASRTFCAAATPIVFRVLSVKSTTGSAQNLGRLFDIPEIAAYVKEVTYCDKSVDGRKPTPELLKIARISAIPELASSFSRIHQLSKLETINLTFFPAEGHPSDSDSDRRLAFQSSILDALVASFSIRAPPKLSSLSLHNLRTCDITPLESPPFQAILKSLRRLRLSVLYDRIQNPVIPFGPRLYSWGAFFCHVVITPTQHTLTELTLDTEITALASSGFSLAGLYFPNLCALSLRKIIFEPSVSVEHFILRHAATLARLELIACRLPIHPDSFRISFTTPGVARDESSARPTHWGPVWDSFAAQLTTLVILYVDVSTNDRRDTSRPEYWYVRPMRGIFYREMEPPLYIDKVDAAALRQFQKIVAARSEAACGAS